MHRIDTPTAQKDKFGQGKNGFTNGDPATGRRATDLNSDMWDAVQEEVCTVIEAAGIPLSKGEHTQLHAAIGRLIDEQVKTRLEKNQNGADIPNKPLFLQNVGLGKTVDQAAGALQKSQNGSDIPDKGLFAQNISAAVAFSGGVAIGGDANPWTTVEFIAWLESQGAFNHPYWMCRGAWSYALNKVITDTGCGNICLAGAVIEVMGVRGALTIRITTPTTRSGGGVASAQFTYINNGDGYAPGWRREFSRTGDEMTGNLYLKNDGRVNFCIMNEDGTPRMWLFKDKGGDGIRINNGNDGGGDYVFHKDGSFYAPLAVRVGGSKKLAVRSDNNSALSAHFNLWGDVNRPTVIELDDDQGWHLYSQRNTDGSVVFYVNGDIHANTLSAGAAIYANNGDVFGTAWGGGNAAWLSSYLYLNMVKAIRLGPVALSGGLWRDFQLGGGQVITGFHTEGDWEMQGGDDKVYYRPVQYLVGDTWVTAPSV
ncbi:hypothetical protein HBD74_000488 [Salmonella enterica]|nr:hypothetical protein [Salmonella enterica]EEU4856170.1 hypothetical protein [Salmonella enterica]EEU4861752.1 hypothetical protein [Salmonella enterica]EEU4870833.1 hypothetical protein [Salmonella enterica]EEU4886856.1 hypothetical protein [Salmonella enterica]